MAAPCLTPGCTLWTSRGTCYTCRRKSPAVQPTPEEKFWSSVIFTDHGLEWTGSKRGPYGRTRINGTQVTAHRLAWELARGPLSSDAILDHAYGCPKTCVTPGHMIVHYSRADHARAGWARGEYDHSWDGRKPNSKDPVTGRFVGST